MNKARLYIIEDQEILRRAYQAFFPIQPSLELVGLAADGEDFPQAVASLQPDALVYSTRLLQTSILERLEHFRQRSPKTSLVLLSALYEVKAIKRLREFARKSSVGCAYLLKHSVDSTGQLAQLIHAVLEGRVILDPAIMEGLIAGGGGGANLLRELTRRELEVLNLMAQGYNNDAIAQILYLDTKTVERHINSVYVKTGNGRDSRDQRVSAVVQYLRATGQLSWAELMERYWQN